MVAAGILNHIGNELGSDGCSTLVLFVLPCIEEVRNDCSDSLCTGRLASMDHDEQLHERGIGRCRRSIWRW